MRPGRIHAVIVVLLAALGAAGAARADLSKVVKLVLQKDRHYTPADLFLHRGDTVLLVNDDDHAIHHAFIDANRFSFDAGDQAPGSQARLTLTAPGDFVIQCGIHPKMKLTLHVD